MLDRTTARTGPVDEAVGDRGFDGGSQRRACHARGVEPVSPPKANRVDPAPLDRPVYRGRNRVEQLAALGSGVGSVLLVGGDSGGPLFTRGSNGETALIGVHMGVDADLLLSASTFLPTPEYVQQIDTFMLADGLRVQIVPVPEPGFVLAVGAGVLAAGRWVRIRRKGRS